MRRVSCVDFKDTKIGCCSSCHDDADGGWAELTEVESPCGRVVACVCCSVEVVLPDRWWEPFLDPESGTSEEYLESMLEDSRRYTGEIVATVASLVDEVRRLRRVLGERDREHRENT